MVWKEKDKGLDKSAGQEWPAEGEDWKAPKGILSLAVAVLMAVVA